MSRVLLVGATGPLGTALVGELSSRGHDVRGVSRSGGPSATALDVTDSEALRDMLRNVKPAAENDLSRPDLPQGEAAMGAVDDAVAAHRRFLVTCADEGVGRMLFASSAAVYGTTSTEPHAETEPLNPTGAYALLKFRSEANLAELRATGAFADLALSFRIFNVYGPGFSQSLITRLVERSAPRPTVYVTDSFVRDYIHASDVAGSLATAIDLPHLDLNVLNLGTGIGTSNAELLALLPQSRFTPNHDHVAPSYSVADMATAREALGLTSFVTIADAVARWRALPR